MEECNTMQDSEYSPQEIWDRIWGKVEYTIPDSKILSQWQLFDLVKSKFLEEILPSGENLRCLECGCGGASASIHLAKKGCVATVIDISSEALRVAQTNSNKAGVLINLVKGDVEKIPFNDESFDVVMSHGLIEHFRDVIPQVKEMIRVLKPGGLIFIGISPNGYNIKHRTLNCEYIAKHWNYIVSFFAHLLMTRNYSFAKDKALKQFKPDYFENELGIDEYTNLFISEGINNIKITGDRPFPHLYLPYLIDRFYIYFMKALMPFWEWFDRTLSSFTKIWGAGWWAYGNKG